MCPAKTTRRTTAATTAGPYVIWGAAVPPDGASLEPDGLTGLDAATLRRGGSLGRRFPKDATWRLSSGSTGALPDNLDNRDGQVVISTRLKELLERHTITNVELLPVRIVDAAGKVLATYFIAHPMRLQLTAWNSTASECTWKDSRVVAITRLVLDPSRIQRPGSLFRVHVVDRPVFVARALAAKLAAAGVTGLRFVEIHNYRLAADPAPDLASLRGGYEAIRDLDDFAAHEAFIARLKRSDAPEVLAFHFELLDDHRNRDLYHRLRAAFAERGAPAEAFLTERLRTKPAASLLADILHLLGTLRSREALALARELCAARDPELRRRVAYVLGWTGEPRDLDFLFALSRDPEAAVRDAAASAHAQVWYRLPKTRRRLIDDLTARLEAERNPAVLGTIVLQLQELRGERYGLGWDEAEGAITGDLAKAVAQARRAGRVEGEPVAAKTRTVIWDSVAATRDAIARDEVYASMTHQSSIDPTNPKHLTTLLALDDDERRRLVPTDREARLTSWRIVQVMHLGAHQLAITGHFEDALRLYDAATLVHGHDDPSLYMNALWAVQDDNHHLGVMRERATRYLERCLPYGPRNPGIYYNAACVQVELGDREGAISSVRDAVRHGYDQLDLMRKDAVLDRLRADPRFIAAFADPALVAERRERVWPDALLALRALDGDWCEIDFELYPAMESPAETREWLRSWTGNPTPPADRLRVFGQDGTGGKVAFWRQDPGRALEREPIVFLGSEGALGVVARDLADFLALFSRNVGPVEVAEHDVGDLAAKLPPLKKVQEIVQRYYPKAARRTVPQILDDARAAAPEFAPTIRAACR